MDRFVVNVVRPGTAGVHRTVHMPDCRYAALSRRHVTVDLAEVIRLLISKANGVDTLTVFCSYCQPVTEMSLVDWQE